MCHWRRWRRASIWLGPALALPGAAAAPGQSPPARDAAETLVLAVVVDGRALDEPVVARRNGTDIRLRAADLRLAGIDVAAGDGEVSLASLPGWSFTIDEARQVIELRSGRLRAGPAGANGGDAPPPLTANGWGAFLNYDASGYADGAASAAGGTFDAVVFTPHGRAVAGAIASVGGGRGGRLARTDIGYTVANPGRLLRATIGDIVNDASSTSRPVRMAGFRIGTDFATRPDLVTFPLPTVSGTAAVASSVDLIVNGDRRSVGEVGSGRFTVSDIPVRTGVNSVAVAVRDPLGRQAVQTVSVYASRELLRPGLSSFSVEAGWIRTGYLSDDDRYQALAASATWRRGISDALTLEGHGEGSDRVAVGSVGGAANLGVLGLGNASVGIGRDRTGGGIATQWALGLERVGRPASFSIRYLRNGPGWHDLAASYGSATPGHSILAHVGFDLGRHGTLALGVIDLGRGEVSRDRHAGRIRVAGPIPASTRLDASYSMKLVGRIGLLVNAGIDVRHRRSAFASIGAIVVFGARTSGYAGVGGGGGGTVASATISSSAVEQGDWGYRADAAVGRVDRVGAAVRHLGRAGLIEAGAEAAGGRVAAQLTARGSIVRVGGRSFLAETMTDSFAVVDSSGQPRVAIYRDHHRVGVTDDAGLLVVPNLPAYQSTQFSIDPGAIDPSLAVGRTEAPVRPGERVGVRVSFDLEANRSMLFTLVDAAGRALPAGALGRFGGVDVPIGFDGQAYFDPGGGGEMVVALADTRRCVVDVPPRHLIAGSTLRAVCGPRIVVRSAGLRGSKGVAGD